MYQVKIGNEIVTAGADERLSDILIQYGKRVEHPCGGRGTCKKCVVWVNGKEELSCQYKIHADIEVVLPEYDTIFSETGAVETKEKAEELCYALDIGTTTIALALVSGVTGSILKVITRTNPQRVFGADVISRISYCMEHGPKELQKVLVAELNEMIEECAVASANKLYVAGNTTMLHLFLGIDCSAMGTAPYTPVFLEGRQIAAEVLGLRGIKEVEVLPSIAAFVGADLVAGLNYVSFPQKGKYNLLVDLGTNAEILLFSEKEVYCTSAAAGPCFEGANISCGMSATKGAVCAYSSEKIETIGNAEAKGICGTGLVDIIAELLKQEVIDETGFMECESYSIQNDVCLTQDDVREFQLAKSAVYAGILTLLKWKQIPFQEVETLYISGGFSAKMNIKNAVKAGILPKELCDRCVTVNNSSLLGTVRYAKEQNDLAEYLKRAEYIDLSANAIFSELFVRYMMFETEDLV